LLSSKLLKQVNHFLRWDEQKKSSSSHNMTPTARQIQELFRPTRILRLAFAPPAITLSLPNAKTFQQH
jgi:hypothetical protein